MRRRQLLEIHDQAWFPASLRDQVTSALQSLLNIATIYRPIVPRLRQAVEQAGAHQILDLCSGAGGPWPWLAPALMRDARSPIDVWLTDKYPPTAWQGPPSAAGARIHRHAAPVDATQVPPDLPGFRTLFTSFHHFPPAEARGILRDALEQRQGIAIFEAPGRYAITLFLVCLIPLAYLLLAPFLRPFRWSRLLWTYLLPVIPLVLLFDGIVSCLRVYSPPELRELLAALAANGYLWEIGVERGGFLRVPITWLIGRPESRQ